MSRVRCRILLDFAWDGVERNGTVDELLQPQLEFGAAICVFIGSAAVGLVENKMSLLEQLTDRFVLGSAQLRHLVAIQTIFKLEVIAEELILAWLN